jgi:hypothetical protein
MAGFFGLFAKKNNKVEDAYFLDSDDAKTFGDIDYMRKSKIVRRTFPKTLNNAKGGELIKEVSSEKMAKKNPNEIAGFKSSSSLLNNSGESNSSFTPQQNRKTDTNMDIFRNMAKQIKK